MNEKDISERDAGGDSNPPALAGENWRAIDGFPKYMVSDLGRVWSENSTRPRLLSPARSRDGYLHVILHRDRKQHMRYVARLVCEAFHGKAPSPQHHAAHLDGDQNNNRATNLAWTTPAENNGHKRAHGTMPLGERVGASKLRREQVLDIAHNRSLSIQQAAKTHGVSDRTAGDIRRGLYWSWLTGIQYEPRGTGKRPISAGCDQ